MQILGFERYTIDIGPREHQRSVTRRGDLSTTSPGIQDGPSLPLIGSLARSEYRKVSPMPASSTSTAPGKTETDVAHFMATVVSGLQRGHELFLGSGGYSAAETSLWSYSLRNVAKDRFPAKRAIRFRGLQLRARLNTHFE